MARAICKVTVHKSLGAANIEYIGRLMEPLARVRETAPDEHLPSGRQLSFEELRETEFNLRSGQSETNADSIWTWNVPCEITDDKDGNRDSFLGVAAGTDVSRSRQTQSRIGDQPELKFSVEEKRERAIAYFSALSDLEERRGGVTHFRLILTVGPEVTNHQIRLLVNAFLGENFPLAEALIAIHRDTAHAHAHIYVHSRQLNNERIQLGQQYFHLDESWMKVCSEQLHKPEIYKQHMELKGVTLDWKGRWKHAVEAGEPLPPKPDRWADHHETKLRLKPWDDVWCGRLIAQTRVAAAKVEYLKVSTVGQLELEGARREAEALRALLDSVAAKRLMQGRSESKRWMAAEIITVSETRDLARYERALEREAQEERSERVERAVTSVPPRVEAEERKVALSKGLSDEEAGQLVVQLDLARARAISLRSEERNFAAMPHRWVSPECGMSLAKVEQQINDRLNQKIDVKDLRTLREQLQSELAEERRSLPHRRAEAEAEVKTLNARLDGELSARRDRGMSAPAAWFTEQQLHELMEHAETSHDTGLLERIYKIESDQAMGDTQATGDPEIIRRLEEKYAGLKLKAEVGLHRNERSLAWAHQHSMEILLPARDNEGRDIVVSLAQYEPQKGLRGVLGKLTEGQERREMRSRLETVKVSYLGHRGGEVKTQASYLRALRVIANDCHQLSRGYGYPVPAAPAISTKEISEIRAYAVKQPEGIAKPWLQQCVQAQALLDNWNTKPYRALERADKTPPESGAQERDEKIQQELQEQRRTLERMEQVPLWVVVPREPPISLGRERSDPDAPNRGGRGGR